jgi:hypothetical protein
MIGRPIVYQLLTDELCAGTGEASPLNRHEARRRKPKRCPRSGCHGETKWDSKGKSTRDSHHNARENSHWDTESCAVNQSRFDK